jgi:hypothetical protein
VDARHKAGHDGGECDSIGSEYAGAFRWGGIIWGVIAGA